MPQVNGSEVESQIKGLEKQCANVKKERSDIAAARKLVQADIEAQRQVLAQLKREAAGVKPAKDVQKYKDQLVKELTESTEQLSAKQKEISELTENYESEQARVKSLEDKLAGLSVEVAQLEKAPSPQSAQSEGAMTVDRLVQSLKDDVDRVDKATKEVLAAIANAEESQDHICSDIDALEKANKVESDAQAALRAEVDANKAAVGENAVDPLHVAAVDRRFEEVTAEREQLKQQLQSLEQEKSKLDAKATALEKTVNEGARAQDLKMEVSQLENKLLESKSRADEISRELDEAEVELLQNLQNETADAQNTHALPDSFGPITDDKIAAGLSSLEASADFKASFHEDRGSGYIAIEENVFNTFVDRVMATLKQIELEVEASAAKRKEIEKQVKSVQHERTGLQEQIDAFQAREEEIHPGAARSVISDDRSVVTGDSAKRLEGRISRKVKATSALKEKAARLSRDILNLQLEQLARFQELLEED